jgi:hypothetical protein
VVGVEVGTLVNPETVGTVVVGSKEGELVVGIAVVGIVVGKEEGIVLEGFTVGLVLLVAAVASFADVGMALLGALLEVEVEGTLVAGTLSGLPLLTNARVYGSTHNLVEPLIFTNLVLALTRESQSAHIHAEKSVCMIAGTVDKAYRHVESSLVVGDHIHREDATRTLRRKNHTG